MKSNKKQIKSNKKEIKTDSSITKDDIEKMTKQKAVKKLINI